MSVASSFFDVGEEDLMRSGTNLTRVREYNQQVVLEAIRERGGASRVEIAKQTGLKEQTVSNIVKRLLKDGLVREGGKENSNGKKPRVRFEIKPDAAYAVGVQIDKDETTLVLVDLAGVVIARTSRPTLQEEGPAAVIEQVARSVGQMVEASGVVRADIMGLGVASPGPLDHAKGIVFETPHLPGWHEVHLKEALERETGYPVIVDRDGTAAAIGERWVGGARGVRSFAFVHVGAGGIGAGLFMNDQVYRGATSIAGAIGHTTLNPDGPECFCGNRGCVEIYCAPSAVTTTVKERLKGGEKSHLREMFEIGPDRVDFEAIRRAALAEDGLALAEIQRSAGMLGHAVVNMVNTLDVELVVLGGKALRGVEHIYRREVQGTLNNTMVASHWREVPIELSMAGDDAGAVGAASLTLHMAYAPRMASLSVVC